MGKEKKWTDYVAENRRLFGIMGDSWSTAALDPKVWYSTVCEGGCRFMDASVREGEKAFENRQRNRETEDVDKVKVAPGVTIASLRRFRAALTGPIQGPPKWCRLCRYISLKPCEYNAIDIDTPLSDGRSKVLGKMMYRTILY